MGAGRGKALAPELLRVTRITPEFTWIFLSNHFFELSRSLQPPLAWLWGASSLVRLSSRVELGVGYTTSYIQ